MIDREMIANEVRQLPQRARSAYDDLVTGAVAGFRVAHRWRITRSNAFLPASTFDTHAAERLTNPGGSECLFCSARCDGEVRAGVLFRESLSDPEIVIEEFALAHMPGDEGHADPLATTAAVLLLDRLHALAVAHDLSSTLSAESCTGASHEQLVSLGFRPVSERAGGHVYTRADSLDRSSHPGRGLELLRVLHRLKSRAE